MCVCVSVCLCVCYAMCVCVSVCMCACVSVCLCRNAKLLGISLPSGFISFHIYNVFVGNANRLLGCCTSAFGTCIQKYVRERYVCLILFMVITQTHVQAVATVH